jgi:hypothetical protein
MVTQSIGFADVMKMLNAGNTKRGIITVPSTSSLTSLELAVWLQTIFCFYLQNRLIQTSQTGGQLYSDTSPFSIPCLMFITLATEQFPLRSSTPMPQQSTRDQFY